MRKVQGKLDGDGGAAGGGGAIFHCTGDPPLKLDMLHMLCKSDDPKARCWLLNLLTRGQYVSSAMLAPAGARGGGEADRQAAGRAGPGRAVQSRRTETEPPPHRPGRRRSGAEPLTVEGR
jgi:hypothetical protein